MSKIPRGKQIAEVSAKLAHAASQAMMMFDCSNIMAINPNEPMILIATRDPAGVVALTNFIRENLSAANIEGFHMSVDQDGNVSEEDGKPDPLFGAKDDDDVN